MLLKIMSLICSFYNQTTYFLVVNKTIRSFLYAICNLNFDKQFQADEVRIQDLNYLISIKRSCCFSIFHLSLGYLEVF